MTEQKSFDAVEDLVRDIVNHVNVIRAYIVDEMDVGIADAMTMLSHLEELKKSELYPAAHAIIVAEGLL